MSLSTILRYILAALAWYALLGTTPAYAGTCALLTVTSNPVSFGSYNGAAISANGSVTVACTVQLGNTLPSFTIALSAGGSNSFATRQMAPTLGSPTLNYNIYTSPSFATVWGNGTAPSVTQSYSAGAIQPSIDFAAYGNLPANQFVAVGAYSDALTVTVTF